MGGQADGQFIFLLGEAFHQLQLLHWFPLLIDGDELQEEKKLHEYLHVGMYQHVWRHKHQ